MADYFPLILRAVSALEPNTAERREAIYVRAREALDRQLLSLDPPIAEPDLRRERGALEATIRRVEAQFAAPQPQFRVGPPQPPVYGAGAVEDEAVESGELAQSAARPDVEAPVRPKVEVAERRSFFANKRNALVLAIGLPVVLLVAVAAYLTREDPGRYDVAQTGPMNTDQSAGPGGRKNDGRLDGTAGPAQPVAGPRPAPPPPAANVLPVSSRVLFFEETPTDPRGIQSDGVVLWRLDHVPANGSRPADQVIRGSFTVSSAKLAGEIVIRRNRDAVLPASHTIEVIFRPEEGREGIGEISPLEMRDQETSSGLALQGAMVPVTTNMFLIGLDRSEASQQRNLDALRERRWLAFQFRFSSGKLGAILIEKGQTGDKVFREAMEFWRQ